MSTRQSKIQIVDRLRQLGLWDDASWFKDQHKSRLMSEGLTRREANERAWEEMEMQFDGENLESHLMLQTVLMGEFPPMLEADIADQHGERRFALVWQLWCLSLARLGCWESDAFEAASFVAARITQVEARPYEEEIVLDALFRVNDFVRKSAAPKFQSVITRLQAFNPSDDPVVEEMKAHVREMSRFGAAIHEFG